MLKARRPTPGPSPGDRRGPGSFSDPQQGRAGGAGTGSGDDEQKNEGGSGVDVVRGAGREECRRAEARRWKGRAGGTAEPERQPVGEGRQGRSAGGVVTRARDDVVT